MSAGFVYLACNASMPGLFKIGATRGSPSFRMKQLTSPTSVPTPFYLVGYMECRECFVAESALHMDYSHCRENGLREFFRLSNGELFDILVFFQNAGLSHWVDEAEWAFNEALAKGVGGNSCV